MERIHHVYPELQVYRNVQRSDFGIVLQKRDPIAKGHTEISRVCLTV